MKQVQNKQTDRNTPDRQSLPDSRSIRSIRKRGAIFAMAGGVCWGFSGTCGQFLFSNTDVSVLVLSCIRMLVGGGILTVIGFITHREQMLEIWKNRSDVLRLILFGIFGLLICQYTYLTAISFSNAATATVLQYLGPVIIMVLMCFMEKKLPKRKEVLALIFAIAGVFLLATHGNPGSLAISRQGLVWGLLSAVGLVLYTMIPGPLIRKWGSFLVTGYGLLIAGFILSLATRVWKAQVTFTPAAIGGIAGVAIPGTAIAFTMYLRGVADVGAAHASLFACTEPVAATIFAAAWLKTAFHPVDLVGFAGVIIAVILLSIQTPEKEKR